MLVAVVVGCVCTVLIYFIYESMENRFLGERGRMGCRMGECVRNEKKGVRPWTQTFIPFQSTHTHSTKTIHKQATTANKDKR